MEAFALSLAICAGNLPVNSLHKGQWRGALMFSLISAWTNSWTNNRYAGGFRRHRAHYDIIVMVSCSRFLILILLVPETEYSRCVGSIHMLLKSPVQQQTWYWLCTTDNIYHCPACTAPSHAINRANDGLYQFDNSDKHQWNSNWDSG